MPPPISSVPAPPDVPASLGRAAATDLTTDRVRLAETSGLTPGLMSITQVLGRLDDQEALSPHQYRLRRLQMRDPAVRAAVEFLAIAASSGDYQLKSPREAEPGTDPSLRPDAAEIALAAEIKAFCARQIDGLERPLPELFHEMCRDALVERSKLAETVYRVETRGPDAGRLVIDRIAPKPRTAWSFVVSPVGRVVGIQAETDAGTVILDRRNFWIQTWDERDGDPRGTSILEAVDSAWNLRIQGWPHLFRLGQRYGLPNKVGTTAPGAQELTVGVNVDGTPRIRTAEQDMAERLAELDSRTCAAFPAGSTVQFLEPSESGPFWDNYFYLLRLEIFLAIVLSTRLMAEARSGSKADSQTAQDVTGNVVRYMKTWMCDRFSWDVLYQSVDVNFGTEAAQLYTPVLTAGVEHQDLPTLLYAFGNMGLKLVPEQVPAIFAMLGLPVPTVDQVNAALDAQAERKSVAQADRQPSTGPPSDLVPKPNVPNPGGMWPGYLPA